MCCAVELKYRARIGRRKVGGSDDESIRTSNMDFLIVLLSILGLEVLLTVIHAQRFVSSNRTSTGPRDE